MRNLFKRKPKPEEIEQWRKDKVRAIRIKRFLESEVWQEDILPMLEEEKKKLQNGIIWNGETRTSDEIAIGCVYNSAAIRTLELIQKRLTTWLEIGKIAEEKLKEVE